MPEADLIPLFVAPLRTLGVRYLVSGSVAAMIYGEPRVTHDIDLIVFLKKADVTKLQEIYPAPFFYVPPPDIIRSEILREQRGHFTVIHADSGLKADFYLMGNDEMHNWAFQNKREYSLPDLEIALAPPEYVIVRKLEYFREGGSEKHLRDIRSMLAVSGSELDREAMADWIQRRGLTKEWERVSE